jgi:acetate kinase
MKIVIINSGSSSIKYQLINMANEVICSGMIDRIGLKLNLTYVTATTKLEETCLLPTIKLG